LPSRARGGLSASGARRGNGREQAALRTGPLPYCRGRPPAAH
jgi:hypothetical protein